MTRRIRLTEVEPPRLITEAETAHLLGLSAAEMSRRVAELEALGLPRRHAILKRRDRRAIEAWLDRLYGVASPAETRRADAIARIAGMGAGAADGGRAH